MSKLDDALSMLLPCISKADIPEMVKNEMWQLAKEINTRISSPYSIYKKGNNDSETYSIRDEKTGWWYILYYESSIYSFTKKDPFNVENYVLIFTFHERHPTEFYILEYEINGRNVYKYLSSPIS